MTQLTRKRALLAKIESSYGVDPTPDGTSNAILVSNLNAPTPLNVEQVNRNLIKPYLANDDQLNANAHSTIEFDVELQGAGDAGDAPAYGPLLRACGHSETITADTKVEYKPISTGFESVTMYFNMDGSLHKMTGARGTVKFEINARGIPVMKFKFVGKYVAAAAAALPTCDYAAFKKPLVANNTNTTGFSFYGYSGVLESLSLDVNASVDFRSLIGSEYVQYTDRKPMGEVLIESPALGTKDFFAISQAETTGALTITHGTVDGYKVQLDCAVVDIANPAYEDMNGVNMLRIPFIPLTVAGGDDYVITVK